jgi:hypothetical protein
MSSNHLEQAAHLEHTKNVNPSKNMRKRASRNAAPTQPNQLTKKKKPSACLLHASAG